MRTRWLFCAWLACAAACGDDGSTPPLPDAAPDPLTVTSVSPADGATGVGAPISIEVTFDRAVDPNSVSEDTVYVESGAVHLAGTLTVSGNTVRLSATYLPPNKTYRIVVTTDVLDTKRVALAAPHDSTFTSVPTAWTLGTIVDKLDTPATSPSLSVTDVTGTIVATWLQGIGTTSSPGNDCVHARTVSGYTWLATAPRLSDNTFPSTTPYVGYSNSSTGAVVWAQSTGAAATSIYAGVASSTTGELVENAAGDAGEPRVEGDSSGARIAVFHQHDGIRNNILWSRRTGGSAWSSPAPLEDLGENQHGVRIAMDRTTGHAVVVWILDAGNGQQVWSSAYGATGWEAYRSVDTSAGALQEVDAGIARNGATHAVWSKHDGARYNVWASSKPAFGGTWSAPVLLEQNNAGDAQSPRIEVDADGNALAIWQQSDGATTSVWSARRLAGAAGWGAPVAVESFSSAAASPAISMDARSGDVVAAFLVHDGTELRVWGARFDSWANGQQGAWSTPEQLDKTAGPSGPPQVAMDPNHGAVVVWSKVEASATNIVSAILHR